MSSVNRRKYYRAAKEAKQFLTIQALEHCPRQVLKLNRENVVVVSVLRGEWKRFFESKRRIMQTKKTKETQQIKKITDLLLWEVADNKKCVTRRRIERSWREKKEEIRVSPYFKNTKIQGRIKNEDYAVLLNDHSCDWMEGNQRYQVPRHHKSRRKQKRR